MSIVQHPVVEDAVELRRHPDFGARRVARDMSAGKHVQEGGAVA